MYFLFSVLKYLCFLNICFEPIIPSCSIRTNKSDMDSAPHCLYKNVFCNIFYQYTLKSICIDLACKYLNSP